jgi:tetratricopeptide (TPR) repeat protein
MEPAAMKKLSFLCLILALALWCGSCARFRGAPPDFLGVDEQLDCQIPHLQEKLARGEMELAQAGEEKSIYLVGLARLSFLLGELSAKNDKRPYFEKGQRFSESLVKEQPAWPDGHYWLAMNLCGLAEQGGARRGLKMVPEIIVSLEQALKINPAYDHGGPHRVLGRMYFECPPWPLSVGSLPESLRHLSAAAAIAPENSTNRLFLGETLLKMGKKGAARQELELVLNGTGHPLCAQFLEEDRQAAKRLLQDM